MSLTDREKEQLKAMIDAGERLPPKYRASLFAEPHEAELIWPGKTSEVTSVVLPFQSIEQIDEPRAEMNAHVAGLFDFDAKTGRQAGGWSNKLIWGENKLVLASLKNGPLRQEIEQAGGLKLVYIDPPFDVGADFSFEVEVGADERVVKEASVIEEVAYRDTWGRGTDSYLSMLYERLSLIRGLMTPDASIYLHVGPNIAHAVAPIVRELFPGIVGEIIWQRTSSHGDSKWWGVIHDVIFFASISSDQYIWKTQFRPFSQEYIDSHYGFVEEGSNRRFAASSLTAAGIRRGETGAVWRGFDPNTIGRHWAKRPSDLDELDKQGKIYWPKKEDGWPREKLYLEERRGKAVSNIWDDIPNV